MSKETVAILGYGRFGRALGQLLAEAGTPHRAYDVPAALGDIPAEYRAASLGDLVAGASFVVVAVPVTRMHGALLDLRSHLKASQIVVDVGSVKVLPMKAMEQVLGTEIPWCGSHPLFGPLSLALAERPLRVVVCPSPLHEGAGARVRALYEAVGCEVIVQTAENHDRVMANTHALTFFVAKGMIDAGAATEVPFAPASYQAIARAIETVRSDAGHLFAAIARDNPFAAGARKELVRALGAIDAELDAQALEPPSGERESTRFSIPDLGVRSPELKEARDHIDAIDEEIVRLLAQRMQLAQRAGRAKAAIGAPVRDEAREADLLATRRAWARETKIDPDAVTDVFRAVLTMSRRGQR